VSFELCPPKTEARGGVTLADRQAGIPEDHAGRKSETVAGGAPAPEFLARPEPSGTPLSSNDRRDDKWQPNHGSSPANPSPRGILTRSATASLTPSSMHSSPPIPRAGWPARRLPPPIT